MTTTDRDFLVYRRRPHLVDIVTPKRSGVQGYRFKAARNFDLTFQTIITADISSGYLDNVALRAGVINRLTLGTAPGENVRIVFDPDTFSAHAANLDDNEHMWLQWFPVDFSGAEGTGGARTLVLPDDENKATGRVVIAGTAPIGATVANSLRLDMPFRMRDLYIKNDESSASAATGTLTFGPVPLAAETVTIDGKAYTFTSPLGAADGDVLIGGTALDSINNLIAAITLGPGAGVTYAAATTLHPSVTAAAGAGTTMTTTANIAGVAGNSITTTTAVTGGFWGAPTLLGGTDSGAGVSLMVASAEGGPEVTVFPGDQVSFIDGGQGTILVRGDGGTAAFSANMTHYLPL